MAGLLAFIVSFGVIFSSPLGVYSILIVYLCLAFVVNGINVSSVILYKRWVESVHCDAQPSFLLIKFLLIETKELFHHLPLEETREIQ